jgi:hypothetical protein
MKQTPRQIFKKLVNKNAIKAKIRDTAWQFFRKALTPREKSELPPPLDFQPVCIYAKYA